METSPYLALAILLGVAILFPLIPLALAYLWARLFSPAKPGAVKNASYECGIESVGSAHIQYHSQYYIYGMVFLVFDVEVVFLLPFAVAFSSIPAGAFVAMLVFLLLLIEGLVWAWSKGFLTWQ